MRARQLVNHNVEVCLWVIAMLLATLLLLGMPRSTSGVVGAERRVIESPPRVTIVSPCEGYFLVAEYPGGEPLVEVGTVVTENTTVGYVQSMDRAATPVRAPVTGTVVKVMFEDMSPVAMGDPLFHIEPPK